MMSPTATIRELYEKSLIEHGVSPLAVGWRDEASQRLRFEKLMNVTCEATEPFVLNELGVGYGALYDYVVSRKLPMAHFRGYDIVTGMIDAARDRLPSNAELVVGERITAPADFSVTSGIFNVRGLPDNDSWARYIGSVLDNMHEYSSRGFAFNMLSSYVDWKANGLYYADPSDWFAHCKRRYSRFVSLIHDYPLWEWTIVVRK